MLRWDEIALSALNINRSIFRAVFSFPPLLQDDFQPTKNIQKADFQKKNFEKSTGKAIPLPTQFSFQGASPRIRLLVLQIHKFQAKNVRKRRNLYFQLVFILPLFPINSGFLFSVFCFCIWSFYYISLYIAGMPSIFNFFISNVNLYHYIIKLILSPLKCSYWEMPFLASLFRFTVFSFYPRITRIIDSHLIILFSISWYISPIWS